MAVIREGKQMIDIHSHILPGIDDGAADIYETLEMAEMAVRSGVTQIVATPHCNIPGGYENYFGERYIHAYERAVEAIRREGIPLQILPGMEAFGTYNLPDLIVDRKIMPINQSRYILTEFDFGEDPAYVADILKRMQAVGAIPVVAHAERYQFIQDRPEIALEWKRLGYLIQVNKGSFTGRFGEEERRAAYILLENDLAAAIASDAHGTKARTPILLDAYEELKQHYSEDILNRVFNENPERICSNRPVIFDGSVE